MKARTSRENKSFYGDIPPVPDVYSHRLLFPTPSPLYINRESGKDAHPGVL